MISNKIKMFTVVVMMCYFELIVAATSRSKLPEKPKEFKDKEGCYTEEIKDVLPFGDSVSPIGYCYRIDCSEQFIHYASCGTVSTDDPECGLTEVDLRLPYPDCCPTIKCDTNDID